MKNYPKYATIDGKKYELNTDFRVALRCFGIINDDTISDLERAMAIIYLIFGEIPDDAPTQSKMLAIASKFLRCGVDEEVQENRANDIDFEQDSSFIYASFMSDYGIDIDTIQHLHWWKYIDLIQGLTEKSVMNRVRDIRNYDVSEITDAKFKNKILKAKKSVELKKKRTKEEQKAINDFAKLFE